MDCIEARALKSSFFKKVPMKSTQQAFLDDLWCVTGINNVSSEDFSVDDLLDFSDKDFSEGGFLEEYSQEDEEKDSLSFSSQDRIDDDNSNSGSNSPGAGAFGSLPPGELALPVADMENLEWLSEIVDDSVSEISLLYPVGSYKEKTGRYSENRTSLSLRSVVSKFSVLCLPYPVPTKARSKKSRSPRRVWSHMTLLLDESALISNPVHSMESFSGFAEPPAKKRRRNAAEEGSYGSQTLRRCTHCGVQKTPQWRTGPLGAKTLCNACGVRFKSGRLFPEYRPACSPTFLGEVHSNSHRKVLEMRKKKETVELVHSRLMVSSF